MNSFTPNLWYLELHADMVMNCPGCRLLEVWVCHGKPRSVCLCCFTSTPTTSSLVVRPTLEQCSLLFSLCQLLLAHLPCLELWCLLSCPTWWVVSLITESDLPLSSMVRDTCLCHSGGVTVSSAVLWTSSSGSASVERGGSFWVCGKLRQGLHLCFRKKRLRNVGLTLPEVVLVLQKTCRQFFSWS